MISSTITHWNIYTFNILTFYIQSFHAPGNHMGNMFDKNYFNRSIENQRGFFWVPNPFPPHQRFLSTNTQNKENCIVWKIFCSTSTNNFKMHIYLLISRCHQFSVTCWSIWREICVILNCNCTRENSKHSAVGKNRVLCGNNFCVLWSPVIWNKITISL